MSRNKPTTRVKSSKKHKASSRRWLERQLNDPYVAEAQKKGYRGRAAFKLLEIDEKIALLKPGAVVVDLGAAPGGWSQVAAERGCKIVAIDLLKMDEIPGVSALQLDFMEEDAPQKLKDILKTLDPEGLADLVLSDMAPNTIGHKQTDHLRIMAVVEAAHAFACEVLKPGGSFVAKVFQGGAQNTLLAEMKKKFTTVKHMKPPASRKESAEQFVIATGFRR